MQIVSRCSNLKSLTTKPTLILHKHIIYRKPRASCLCSPRPHVHGLALYAWLAACGAVARARSHVCWRPGTLVSDLVMIGLLILFVCVSSNPHDHLHHLDHPGWLVNLPPVFNSSNHNLGIMVDGRNDTANIAHFEQFTDYFLARTDAFTDGEVVDAAEHFFWGMRDGLAMELGALDGSPNTRSMTFEYEKTLGWHRILVEGNPAYRTTLAEYSPLAFGVNAAICEKHMSVHFRQAEYVGGILEFMGQGFLKEYHNPIFAAGTPPGNVSSVDWSKQAGVILVDCIPLGLILHRAHARHINYFILDVEGGELEVLKSINWEFTRFDVLCIETEASNRPPNFAEDITLFLGERGYNKATVQQGRNIWYTHEEFKPSKRPHLPPACFNGARKSAHADRWYLNRRTAPFQKCEMTDPY